jgi:hypothetical protein
MSAIRWIVLLVGSVFVGSCGLYVPEIQDFPGDKVTGQQLVQSIVYNVTCEVQDAVDKIYNNPDHPVKSTFLDTWGVQITLSLQVEEKSSTNPIVNWLPPSPATNIFNLSVGGTLSSDATRQDKLNSYFTIQQIRALGPCDPKTRPGGVLLLQSNLALDEWLIDNVTAGNTGEINYRSDYSDGPFKQNVLSHEVKFDITDTGNLTPGWKMTRVQVTQSGNLFSATRDRTNDVQIVLGPTIPTPKIVMDKHGKLRTVTTFGPSNDAYTVSLSSQIGLAVSNALKSSQLP